VDTTNIYAEVDLEMKAKALACVDILGKDWSIHRGARVASVLEFMRRL